MMMISDDLATTVERLAASQGRTDTLAKRFAAKVPTPGIGCWAWAGFIDKAGYGRLRRGGRAGFVDYAHRVAYELFKGPIDRGTEIDHLCRNRWCCNPDHLEAVTHQVNFLRGSHLSARTVTSGHCQRGHLLAANAYTYQKTGSRQCLACRAMRRRRKT